MIRGKDTNVEIIINAGVMQESVSRFGAATKEHLVSYSGVDNEFGFELKRGLKSTANSKVNPEFEYQNMKQQAGFSAETKHTARQNAERIIDGKKTRVTRTDDIGRVNDPLYDHVELDSMGNVIEGSGSQMKFIGRDPQAALKGLSGKKFEKYLTGDAKIDVPSDHYEQIKKLAYEKQQSCIKQAEKLKSLGNMEKAQEKLAEAKKFQKIEENVRDSGVSTEEAMEARTNPRLSTAKDIGKVAHRAGLEGAKYGATIGGGIALTQNLIALAQGKKEITEAVTDTAKKTAGSAVTGYITGATGSTLKGIMQNSTHALTRSLSKSFVPASAVAFALETGKVLSRYTKGEISGTECMEELSQKAATIGAVGVFAVGFQAAIPIPVVGALLGSMVGYTLCTVVSQGLIGSLKEAKIARKQRIAVEQHCQEVIEQLHAFKKEIDAYSLQYITHKKKVFNDAFQQIETAIGINDIDSYIGGMNTITAENGGKILFKNFNEFDTFMKSDETLKL
jgi:hypothetical protein